MKNDCEYVSAFVLFDQVTNDYDMGDCAVSVTSGRKCFVKFIIPQTFKRKKVMFEDSRELSKQLVVVLDYLGYGAQQRQFRKTAYKVFSEKESNDYFDCIVVGSKGEGLTNVYENDKDDLLILKSAVCSENATYRDPKTEQCF